MRIPPFVPYLTGVCLAATALVALELHEDEQPTTAGRPAPQASRTPGAPSTAGTTSSAPSSTAAPDRFRTDADLPAGPPVPLRGAGTWRVVPGGFGDTGTPYAVEVEDGVVPPRGDGPFAAVVDHALAHPRGWRAVGHAFRRVDASGAPELRIRLASQETARALCGFELPYDTSCRIGPIVYLSAARWLRGAHAFAGNLRGYRTYAVNHEVGHFLGRGHETCPADGALAPVMMQQTFSTANDDLAAITVGTDQGVPIAADGRTCVPNPWPAP
ncbi:DUF3152 domain-containing protein [Saccharothrix xinjiangensis]|uniref:DUF3152 domain-containing protein n=1 Tax=Saccharothrix xinjiangensis TaxID=204798 RepID=A0ABV9XSG5_9PSEU